VRGFATARRAASPVDRSSSHGKRGSRNLLAARRAPGPHGTAPHAALRRLGRATRVPSAGATFRVSLAEPEAEI
jgi:hypothetical protein